MKYKLLVSLFIVVTFISIIGCSSKGVKKINYDEVKATDVNIVYNKKMTKFFPDIKKEETKRIVDLYNDSLFISEDLDTPNVHGILEPTDDELSASSISISINSKTRYRITLVENNRLKVNYFYQGGQKAYFIKQENLKKYFEEKLNEEY